MATETKAPVTPAEASKTHNAPIIRRPLFERALRTSGRRC